MGFKDLHFIAPEPAAVGKKDPRPASYVRREFTAKEAPEKAVLYMTALGIYRGFLNGEPLDDRLLLPGFTNYRKRLQVQEFDLTDRVKEGANVITVILGDGWYRGALGVMNGRNYYGDRLALAGRLVLTYADGSEEILDTDPTWEATQNGPIRENDLKKEETVDARMELCGWEKTGYTADPAQGWHACAEFKYDGALIAHEGPAVREMEWFVPEVIITPDGATVLDFGQNLAGHVWFRVTGRAGQKVTMKLGECLDENGCFTTKNLEGDGGKTSETMALGQILQYTLKEGTQEYRSEFLISGYRYALLINWPETVQPENFASIAVYSDNEKAGTFTCSNEKINQFVKNSQWSWRSNSVEIPTDCPTRERAGWTGDINVFSETANYYCNADAFLKKFLNDMVTLQTKEGSLPYIAPEVPIIPGKFNHFAYSSAGWSDALVNIPFVLYNFYGDPAVFDTYYETAKRFVDYDIGRALKGRKKYLLDNGFHWGEWLEPGSVMGKDAMHAFFKPDAEVATAWLYHSTVQVADMAAILGKPEDEAHYRAEAEKLKAAYRQEFLKDGMVHSKRQCRYVRPVIMGLVTKEEAEPIVAALNKMVKAGNYKIGTGFLTTWKVLQTLTDFGYVDTAYKLMENEECPGWLYEVKKGATTTWENWLGIDDNGKPENSLNHYAPGAAAAWLFSHVAGIRPAEPGFRKIRIQPIPGGTLTHAEATYHSVQGTITSAWKIDDEGFHLHVEIPEGVPAEIILPDGQVLAQTEPVQDYCCKR